MVVPLLPANDRFLRTTTSVGAAFTAAPIAPGATLKKARSPETAITVTDLVMFSGPNVSESRMMISPFAVVTPRAVLRLRHGKCRGQSLPALPSDPFLDTKVRAE